MINFPQDPDLMRLPERAARGLLGGIDAAANRLYGWRWNPVHQSGSLAVAMLLLLLATGLPLIFLYRIGSPAESVALIAADPWLGSWTRSLHRYASDLFLVAAGLHMLRMFAQGRSWGPRTLAWVSGLVLFGTGVVCAWTGFVMAWDSFGERLARDGARYLDVLPILSEPLSRIFAGDSRVPSAFFFVNLFVHIGLPLAMGALIWLHVMRTARPALLPPRRVTWGVVAALTVAAVLLPARLGPPADPFQIPATTPVDLLTAWWLPLSERITPAAGWMLGLGLSSVLLLVPLLSRRPRVGRWAPSDVDARLCTGCDQCTQDCPWEAITMVERRDGRATLLASVNTSRCVSCGICSGSCAPMGIGPPGRTGRDQLALVRAQPPAALAEGGRGSIVALCCNEAPRAHVEAIRGRGADVRSLSCTGNLHSSVVERLLALGAQGVIVFTCGPRDCASREGPKWLDQRLYHEREAELQERVDRRRLRVAVLAPGNLRESLAAYDAFAGEVAPLHVPGGGVDYVEPECEAVEAGRAP